MKKLTLLFLLIFFHTSFLFAQQNRIDSLLQILKTTTEDSNKLKLLNTITSLCIPNYQKALPYAEEAKLLAEKLPNNKIAAIAYGNLGVVYGYFGFYEKSFDNFLNELRISEELKDTAMIIISNSQLADIYTKAGNYKKALEIALSAEKIVLRTENKKKIARGLWDLSSAYLNLCKKSIRDRDSIFANSYYDKLVDCRSRALIIYKELKDTLGLIFFLNNLGIVFDKCTLCENSKLLMGTQLIRSNYFQLALETYAKAIELSNGIKDSEGVSWAYLNLGDFYKNQGNLFKEKGILSEAKVNFGKSLDFYLKALKIISLLKFPHGIATYNSRVGSAYLKLENPQEAEQYLLAAAKGFKTLGFKEGAKEAYEMLAEANLKKGDYKKTFEFYKNFSTLKDSLFNEEVTKQLAEISFKYETEKKEKENVKLKLDNQAKEADVIKKTNEVRRQRDYKRIFFLAVLALCIIIYLMVRNRRIKIKANK
ncbi:MAG TPA: tetratricopeptide repeat protein, partial [Chitinophagaceae bacterium]|nr:tetratricopeptide repeat protein [Chitinophagaceae bacterium]